MDMRRSTRKSKVSERAKEAAAQRRRKPVAPASDTAESDATNGQPQDVEVLNQTLAPEAESGVGAGGISAAVSSETAEVAEADEVQPVREKSKKRKSSKNANGRKSGRKEKSAIFVNDNVASEGDTVPDEGNPWPDDDDFIEEEEKVADLDPLLVTADVLATCTGKQAILSTVVAGRGRDAAAGNVFLVLRRSALMPGFELCLYQVAATPSDPEEPRRASRIATSSPAAERNTMSLHEVSYIDFEPESVMFYVSKRGWSQALAMEGKQLRFSRPCLQGVVPYSVTREDVMEKEESIVKPGPPSLSVLPARFLSLGSLSSVPGGVELKEQYRPSAALMFRVAPPVIAQAEAAAKGSSQSDLYDKITRRRDEGAQAGKTLVKLGASQYLLHVVSVAAAEVLCMPLSTVAAAYHHRVSCPINMVAMVPFVISWRLPSQGKCLAAFVNLSRAYGQQRASWRGRQYAELLEVDQHSEIYNTLITGAEGSIFGADIPIAYEATMNLLLLLFMLTGMRYCFQYAMIQAVERAFVYIRANDFGINSTSTPLLIRLVLVELFVRFDELRTQILTSRNPDATLRDEIVVVLGALPNLAPNSETGLIVERLRLSERDTQVSFLLDLNELGVMAPIQSPVKAAVTGVLSPVGPRKRRKAKPGLSAGSVVSGSAHGVSAVASSSSSSSGGSGVVAASGGAAAVTTGGGAVGRVGGAGTQAGRVAGDQYCTKFLSTTPCPFGASCTFLHRIPSRASAEYKLAEARLTAKGFTPSADFVSAV